MEVSFEIDAVSVDSGSHHRRIVLVFVLLSIVFVPITILLAADQRLSQEEARKLTNLVALSDEVLRDGRKSYLRLCQYCHGADGRAQANPDFAAPSLREPAEWNYGSTDGEIFVSIRDGAGHEMPPFGKQLSEEQIWRVVHYLRSIGPESTRPSRQNGNH